MCWYDSQMLAAIGRISSGSAGGTACTHASSSPSVSAVASARLMPATCGLRASSDRRVPWQTGHVPCLRKRATRPRPFSSFTFANAFSTV